MYITPMTYSLCLSVCTSQQRLPFSKSVRPYEPRSDKRDLLAIKVKSEIFTQKEGPSCCEQFAENLKRLSLQITKI